MRAINTEFTHLTGLLCLIVIIQLRVNTFPIDKTNHGIKLRFYNLFASKEKQDSQSTNGKKAGQTKERTLLLPELTYLIITFFISKVFASLGQTKKRTLLLQPQGALKSTQQNQEHFQQAL